MGICLIFQNVRARQEPTTLTMKWKEVRAKQLSLFHFYLTLKDPGFLVFQIPGGGVESTHFEKRSLTTPHFHSRPANSISYESWHILLKFDTLLRLLRLKLRPREAAEVAKVQAKKIRSKILKSAIFELQKRYIPQKKAENNCHSDLK